MSQAGHAEDDSVVAQLVAALAHEGEYVDAGQFGIDLTAAATLARYQLADPSLWPVFLVEVAVLLGAAQIRFGFSGWVIEAELVGAAIDPNRVTQLVDGVEGLTRSEGHRGRDPAKLLGVAWRAACARSGDQLMLEVIGEDRRGRRRRWIAAGEGSREDCEGEPGLRLWLRFAADASEPGEAERAWLLRRCRPSSFPVFIDDQRISIGWVGAFGSFGLTRVTAQVPIERDGQAIGLAGLHEHPPAGSRVLLMQNGVVVEELGFPVAIRAFIAVVEIEADRDLSLTRFVRGPALASAMAVVQAAYPEVREQSLAAARRLATALVVPAPREVAAADHETDQLALREATRDPSKIVGGVAAALGAVSLVALGAGGAGAWTLLPVALLGVGLFLLVGRELG
jgi:hypothetical protein